MNLSFRPLALALALVLAVMAASAARAGGIDSLAQFVKNTRSGQADFTQTVTAPGKDGQPPRVKTQSGGFAFQRPGKFRFDYRQPFEQTIVADGQTLWLYDADLNQVTARGQAQALGSTPAAIVAAAPDLKALEQNFDLADEPDQGGLQWLRATPKMRDTQIQSVRVGFAGAAALSVLEITDSFGQRSVLRFTGFQANPALPAQTFEFHPPAGADVVRN
jgi:outer membrane lipoprotein carrier protein